MNSWMDEMLGIKSGIEIPAYDQMLLLPLKLYHYAYQKYNVNKDKEFANTIIDLVNELLGYDDSTEMIEAVTAAYTTMLSDLSFAHGTKKTAIWRFSREELSKLFDLEINLINRNHQNPIEQPLKGILMMQISNFILKSRNDFNEDNLCKYVSPDVAKYGIVNHQLWMKQTSLLNDEREEKVIPEIFQEEGWIPHDWAKDIDSTETRIYFVSSFSEEINNERRIWGCIYGYKDDRVAELIAPIYKQNLVKKQNVQNDELPDKIKRPFFIASNSI